MKRVLPLLMVMVLSFAFTAVSSIKETAAEKPEAARLLRAKLKQINGTVVSIDRPAMTFTLKGMKAEMVIEADEEMLSGLKTGDKVGVRYIDQDGRHIAQKITKAGEK